MLHMAVYFVVFKFLLHRGGENFTAFLLIGLIPWLWFNRTVSSSSSSIIVGKNLMLQSRVPPVFFPLVKMVQSTLKQIPVFVVLLIFVWFRGFSPGLHWFALFPLILVQAIIIFAFVLVVSAVIPFVRDFSYLVPTGLAFMFFLSGIFYDYRTISPEWQGLFLKNPMAYLLTCYRKILMEQSTPNFATLFYVGLIGTVVCVVLTICYKKLRYVFPRVVME